MNAIPREVGDAKVVLYSPIDHRHRHTGNCRQIVDGALMGAAAGLAICKDDEEGAYYLFGCDENWETLTDTWHQSMDEAKRQAEFEYEGVSATWKTPDDSEDR